MEENQTTPLDTLAHWCSEAILVQSACNLSGVLQSWAKICSDMIAHRMDTMEIRRHPACILFSDKVSDMCGRPSFDEYSAAYDYCETAVRDAAASHRPNKGESL